MLQPLPHGAKGAGKVPDSGSSSLHLSPGQHPLETAALGLVDKRQLKGLGGALAKLETPSQSNTHHDPVQRPTLHLTTSTQSPEV